MKSHVIPQISAPVSGGGGVATHPLYFKDDHKVKVHSEVQEHSLTKTPSSV